MKKKDIPKKISPSQRERIAKKIIAKHKKAFQVLANY